MTRLPTRLATVFLLAFTSVANADEVPTTERQPTNWYVTAEGGALLQSRNTVRIPSLSGTQFSLSDAAGTNFNYRFYLGYRWGEQRRHEVRAVVAPLSMRFPVTFGSAVNFQNQTFAAGTATEATYQVHSYRVTYRYLFFAGEEWRWFIGVTAQVRDTRISLTQATLSAEKKEDAFAPLVHVRGEWQIAENWALLLDVDTLAAPQGRTADVQLAASWNPIDQWTFVAGYRGLENGYDNRDEFASSLLHCFNGSLQFAW